VVADHRSIMLSSTWQELKEHRAAVREAALGQGLCPEAMENDAARPQDLIDASSALRVSQ